ncbi:DNA cytosine methyltransferase [Aminobacterium mobile]
MAKRVVVLNNILYFLKLIIIDKKIFIFILGNAEFKEASFLKKTFRVLSLFSGCGGMDIGFEGNFDVFPEFLNEVIHPEWVKKVTDNGLIRLPPTGFKTVFANDIMPESMRAWTKYFNNRRHKSEKVFKLGSVVDYVKIAKKDSKSQSIFPKNIDIVTGGFPCNDFSVAGKRLGFESHKSHKGTLRIDEPCIESRGQLYIWMKEVIEITKPYVFVAENVKGLVSLGDAKTIIENDFRGVDGGYVVVPARVLKATDYGVPQTRERIFFIGFRKDALKKKVLKAYETGLIPLEFDPYPIPTHAENSQGALKPYTTVRQALKGLPEPKFSNDLSHIRYSKAKFMGRHCQGQKEIDLDTPGPTIRAEHHGNIEFRRLSPKNGGKIFNEFHLEERRLTVRECARIQTFPDDYEFVIKEHNQRKFSVNATMAYKMVGNAVPPLLAYHVAQRLREIWNTIFK